MVHFTPNLNGPVHLLTIQDGLHLQGGCATTGRIRLHLSDRIGFQFAELVLLGLVGERLHLSCRRQVALKGRSSSHASHWRTGDGPSFWDHLTKQTSFMFSKSCTCAGCSWRRVNLLCFSCCSCCSCSCSCSPCSPST